MVAPMSPDEQKIAVRRRGRPREFDMDDALDRAIAVFRERGYHATSLADIKAATSLASGSIYKAFKDKRAIFLAAFDRYVSGMNDARELATRKGLTGRDKLRDFLRSYVQVSSGAEGRLGCLVVGTAIEAQTLDDEIAGRVKAALARNEARLASLIKLGQEDGSIAPHVDSPACARLMLCILQGMRVVGTTGRTRAQMEAVVDLALKVLG